MKRILRDIADAVGGEVHGDDQEEITGIQSIEKASRGELSFFVHKRYRDFLEKTNASALIVTEVSDLYKGPQILVSDPGLAHARVAGMFASPGPAFSGISPGAVIAESGIIGSNVTIYPTVYVGENTTIGDGVTLFPGVYIGDRVRIGNRTVIYPNVSVMHECVIGENVIIHAGSVIGSEGFGFAREGDRNIRIPQIGIVQIDEQAEIGANNCIDRATLGRTWIKRGVKTDNLIQIAHNVVIGENTVIVAQTGISGSVEIGCDVVIGGQVGVKDHVKIGDRAMIGPGGGVYKSISAGEVVSGRPVLPHKLWLRVSGLIARLPTLFDRLKALEKKVQEMKGDTD